MVDPLIGKQLGNYILEEKLGYGGSGVVYRARHARLATPFAVKILHPILASNEESADRFLREAQVAARIRHNNVVFIADFDIEPGIGPYFVMEFLDGESLRDLLDREEFLLPPRVVRLTRQICHALDAAHHEGITHRDLKPENIYLVRRGDREIVKLLDFGIAKITRGSLEHQEQITQNGRIMGTPRYFAPEQAKGQKIDNRSDLYSLGVILYEMFIGTTPFQGTTPEEMILQHLAYEPPPLVPFGFPKEMENFIHWVLSKNPDDRPQDVEELWDAFKQAASKIPSELFEKPHPTKSSKELPQVDTEVEKNVNTTSSYMKHQLRQEEEEVNRTIAWVGRATSVSDDFLGAADTEHRKPISTRDLKPPPEALVNQVASEQPASKDDIDPLETAEQKGLPVASETEDGPLSPTSEELPQVELPATATEIATETQGRSPSPEAVQTVDLSSSSQQDTMAVQGIPSVEDFQADLAKANNSSPQQKTSEKTEAPSSPKASDEPIESKRTEEQEDEAESSETTPEPENEDTATTASNKALTAAEANADEEDQSDKPEDDTTEVPENLSLLELGNQPIGATDPYMAPHSEVVVTESEKESSTHEGTQSSTKAASSTAADEAIAATETVSPEQTASQEEADEQARTREQDFVVAEEGHETTTSPALSKPQEQKVHEPEPTQAQPNPLLETTPHLSTREDTPTPSLANQLRQQPRGEIHTLQQIEQLPVQRAASVNATPQPVAVDQPTPVPAMALQGVGGEHLDSIPPLKTTDTRAYPGMPADAPSPINDEDSPFGLQPPAELKSSPAMQPLPGQEIPPYRTYPSGQEGLPPLNKQPVNEPPEQIIGSGGPARSLSQEMSPYHPSSARGQLPHVQTLHDTNLEQYTQGRASTASFLDTDDEELLSAKPNRSRGWVWLLFVLVLFAGGGTYLVRNQLAFLQKKQPDKRPVVRRAAALSCLSLMTLNTEPSGAEILEKGKVLGTTPYMYRGKCNTRAVLYFRARGYLMEKRLVFLSEGSNEITFPLRKPGKNAKSGMRMMVYTTPAGVSIFEKRKFLCATPCELSAPAKAVRRYRLIRKGYRTKRVRLRFDRNNAIRRFKLVLKRKRR